MKLPLHVIIRKKISFVFSAFLSLFQTKQPKHEYVNADAIQTILLIRPNYRIGNLLFLTPLLNALEKQLPNAKIDIVVGMRLAGKILEPLPNVHKVIDVPRELLLHPQEIYAATKSLRKTNYDIAINVSGGSTSAQIIATFVKAKNKASFQNKKLWANFTHLQTRGTKTYRHMGLESLEFLRFFNIPLPKTAPNLDIRLTQQEIDSGYSDLKALLQKHHISGNKKVIALFRNARFDKKIDDTYWKQWIAKLMEADKSIVVVDILSPDIPTPLNDSVLSYQNKNLRMLGAFFRACDLYVSADTGPMHLAVASGAKVLALFNKTDIEVYGALGEGNKSIDIEEHSLDAIVQTTLQTLQITNKDRQ
jgi:ADP-heptose:LPS heptosyltransferase